MHKLNIDPWFVNKAKQIRDGRLNAYDTLDATKTAKLVMSACGGLRGIMCLMIINERQS